MVLFQRAAGWALGAILISSGLSAADSHHEQPLDARSIPRIEGVGVRVDGYLDEAAWQAALEVPLAFENYPGDGIAAPVETRVYLVYDETHLYIGFRAFDPEPAKIRAHLMDSDRQATFEQDDYVAVVLDTYNDSRRGFEFRVNPRGVQMDGLYSQVNDNQDFSWDVIWDSAGRIDEQGYLVEMAIPFDQLRFLHTEGDQVWGISLSRLWPRDVLRRLEAHAVDRNDGCGLCQAPRFSGFAGLAPGRNLELTPTLTFEHREQVPENDPPGSPLSEQDDEIEAGVSLRWGITPSLTLNATYNPDFSQVESDALQLSTNQRFALQFDEQRQFFLEGSDFFVTPIQAVFSRTVQDPSFGLKLTGKVAPRSALGFFVAEDDVNFVVLSGVDRSDTVELPGKVRTAVGRYRQDLGKSSTLGILYTDRQGEGGYSNRVGGIDAQIRWADRHQLRLQALSSDTRYPERSVYPAKVLEDPGSGHAIEALYLYNSRDWNGSVGWRSYDDDFRIDSGFLGRTGFETWRSVLGRTYWGEQGAFVNQANVSLTWIHTRNQIGERIDNKWDLQADFAMPRQSNLALQLIRRDERFQRLLFEEMITGKVELKIQPSEALALRGKVQIGESIDFVGKRPADERLLTFEMEVKPDIHWNVKLFALEQDLEIAAGQLSLTRLAELRLTYQLSTRSFFRYIAQYQLVDVVPRHFAEPPDDYEHVAGQLLYSYKLNPQTLLFIGYSDEYIDESAESIQGLEPRTRSFFFKLSYAFTR